MNEKYFVIYNSDGDTYVQIMNEDELKRNLNDDSSLLNNANFINETNNFSSNTNYWGDKTVMIIKGKILVPKPVQKIIEWEF